MHRRFAALLVASLVAGFPFEALADVEQAVRVAVISYAQLQKHFLDPVVVDPVVFTGRYALADWIAGQKQGEALLLKSATGKWHVVALENSSLADARFLTLRYHVPSPEAATLVKAILAAEKREGARP